MPDIALAIFSHPFYAHVLALPLLKASFNGFAVPGIPLPLVSPSSFTGEDVLVKFHRSQPIACQQPRLTATSDLIWQPKPTSVTLSEGRIFKQQFTAGRPGHDIALAIFSQPFYAQVLALSLLKASLNGFAVPGIPLPLVSPSSFPGEDVLVKFHRSQPIACQQPRLTATSDLIWQPKPTSASLNGFAAPGIPLPLVSPSSFAGEDVLVKFHRSQPIACQQPRLTATSDLIWQPKPTSVILSEGRIFKQQFTAGRPGHDIALAIFSHPFYAQVLALSLLKASFNDFAVPGIALPLVSPSSFTGEDVLVKCSNRTVANFDIDTGACCIERFPRSAALTDRLRLCARHPTT
ncbi:hypothetical protein MTO96_010022 [Rhipicephalus appendiculatus]